MLSDTQLTAGNHKESTMTHSTFFTPPTKPEDAPVRDGFLPAQHPHTPPEESWPSASHNTVSRLPAPGQIAMPNEIMAGPPWNRPLVEMHR